MASTRDRHEQLMRLALAAAEHGRGRTRPNPIVGCVIARGGRVVGTGYHRRAGLPHAEVEALATAGTKARGADVYVTLEPCNHYGRTGPCVQALLGAGVARVFVGALDPNPLVHGKGVRALRKAGVAVEVGVLGEECRAQNAAFAHYMKTRRPLVIAKIAESLDGRVATRTGQSRWITGPEARRFGHRLRDACDGIVVGVGTVLADDPALNCRVRGGRDPIRVVVDSEARTPLDAQVVRLCESSSAPTLVVVGERAPEQRARALGARGVEVVRVGEHDGRVDLAALLDELGRRELLSVLVEGGPTLMGGLFDAGLVDELHVILAPTIIGGAQARSSVLGEGPASLAKVHRLRRYEVTRLGADLLVSGAPRRR